MKEFKGTRGKWIVGNDIGTDCTAIFSIDGLLNGGSPICIVAQEEYMNEEQEANAQLIAAAPKLLTMLQSIVLSIKAHPDYQTKRNQEFIDYVQLGEQTINEALGEE